MAQLARLRAVQSSPWHLLSDARRAVDAPPALVSDVTAQDTTVTGGAACTATTLTTAFVTPSQPTQWKFEASPEAL